MTPFRYYFRVKFHECDPQGVVFNSRYCEYASVAACEFMRAIARPEGPSSALVKQVTEWKSPARFDDVLEARVSAVHIGTSSFRLGLEFRIAKTGTLACSNESFYVLLDDRYRSRALPDELRASLERGAAGRFVDHAAHFQRELEVL